MTRATRLRRIIRRLSNRWLIASRSGERDRADRLKARVGRLTNAWLAIPEDDR